MYVIFPPGWLLSECQRWLRKRGCNAGYLGWWHDHERQKHGFALEPDFDLWMKKRNKK